MIVNNILKIQIDKKKKKIYQINFKIMIIKNYKKMLKIFNIYIKYIN